DEAREAVRLAPQYAINHLVLADAYMEKGRKDDAIKEWQGILTAPVPSDAMPETHADQETAREHLKALNVPEQAVVATPASSTQSSCESQGGHWDPSQVNACTQ